MSTDDREGTALAEDTAEQARAYLMTLREVAAGQSPAAALPLLLLAAAQIQLTGARLGAMVDVVLAERFEADAGPDADLDPVRTGLRQVLAGVDDYVDLTDPVLSGEVTPGSLTDDLCVVAADLMHGLRHAEEGRPAEALWWWQFSYLSSWGDRAASTVRVLHGLLAHVRLDADVDEVAEAEFDALHPGD